MEVPAVLRVLINYGRAVRIPSFKANDSRQVSEGRQQARG
jgi:hypothetical protein